MEYNTNERRGDEKQSQVQVNMLFLSIKNFNIDLFDDFIKIKCLYLKNNVAFVLMDQIIK